MLGALFDAEDTLVNKTQFCLQGTQTNKGPDMKTITLMSNAIRLERCVLDNTEGLFPLGSIREGCSKGRNNS